MNTSNVLPAQLQNMRWVNQTITGTDAVWVIDAITGWVFCLHHVTISGAAASVVDLLSGSNIIYEVQGTAVINPGQFGPCVVGPIKIDQSGAGKAAVTIGYTRKKL